MAYHEDDIEEAGFVDLDDIEGWETIGCTFDGSEPKLLQVCFQELQVDHVVVDTQNVRLSIPWKDHFAGISLLGSRSFPEGLGWGQAWGRLDFDFRKESLVLVCLCLVTNSQLGQAIGKR